MNPYQTPTDSSPGVRDWWLLKRFLLATSVILIVLLSCVSIHCWQVFHNGNAGFGRYSTIEEIQSFFLDWKPSRAPR